MGATTGRLRNQGRCAGVVPHVAQNEGRLMCVPLVCPTLPVATQKWRNPAMEKAELEILVAATLSAAAFPYVGEDKSIEGAIDCFQMTLQQMRVREIMPLALSGKPLTRR